MNIKSLLFAFSMLLCTMVCAQVTTVPAIIQKGYTGPVTIIFNPNEGNKGMVGATACYAHTGYNNWVGAPTWCSKLAKHKMTKNTTTGNWELTMPDGLYTYYGITTATNVTQLCFVFNDGVNGGKTGKTASNGDIFVKLADSGLQAKMTTSMSEISISGQSVTIVCNATETADMTLTLNGNAVKTASGTEMTYTGTLTQSGANNFILSATAGGVTKTATATTYVCAESPEEVRPTGLKMGVTYDSNSPTGVTLCTYAAGCKTANNTSVLEHAKTVYVVGSFTQWNLNENYQMKRDGNYFWLKFNVAPGTEHTYQYLVVRSDGKVVRVSDLYSTRLKENVTGADGYASVLQTQVTPYQWSDATLNFKRPNKNNLVIYELWVYDHTASHNLKGLMNRLDYFSELGVNCIELMPVNEFDGDLSWGYCPNHYFAVDKQYGQPNDLKAFVDACHARGIAVVLDMVLNHATGNNPMNKLYPYGTDLAYNPWFNVTAPHSDNVYEDWNHDFEPTHQMMIDVLKFWMEEYKVDGYRLDLSHGLCGKSYNAVANLKDYYNKAVKPLGGYMMLEHWGSSMGSDRPQLVNEGMMCWQNTCEAFYQTAMGWLKDGDDFANANMDNYVSYPENHDEERTFYKVKTYGNGDLKTNESARCARIPLNVGFQCMLNGPQLFYHFTEVGFEIGKFQNKSGVTGTGEQYKMEPKEAYKMTWTSDTALHMQAMRAVGKIIRLRTRYMPKVFEGNPTAQTIGSGKVLRSIQWGNNVVAVGNFGVSGIQAFTMPSGTWYDYLGGNQKATSTITLSAGQIKVFTNDPTVGIDEVCASGSADGHVQKVLVDGQICILVDGVSYNLLGAKVK